MIHSKYSPSRLTRIIACPGSVSVNEDLVSHRSSYADEGTLLHAVVEHCLDNDEYTLSSGTKTKFNITQEQKDAVQSVLDYVTSLRLKYAQDTNILEVIEQHVSLKPYVKKTACDFLEDVEGTLDYSMVIPSKSLIVIADWKFGKGIEVFADSDQLKAYALGRLATLEDWQTYTHVETVIVQPRLYNGETIKTETYTIKDLSTWLYGTLIPALVKANLKYPPFNPSEKGCMWCGIKNTCEYRRAVAQETAVQAFSIFKKIPDKIDLQELVLFLDNLPQLKTYITDIKNFAITRLSNGQPIPGYKLVAGKSNRTWSNEDKVKTHLLSLDYEIEDIATIALKSPAQMEKSLGKAQFTTELKDFIIKPAGNPTMVKESDKRQALYYENVEEKFKAFINNDEN
jgi:hypothetical protein